MGGGGSAFPIGFSSGCEAPVPSSGSAVRASCGPVWEGDEGLSPGGAGRKVFSRKTPGGCFARSCNPQRICMLMAAFTLSRGLRKPPPIVTVAPWTTSPEFQGTQLLGGLQDDEQRRAVN